MKTVTGWCLFDCEQLMCFVILHLNWDWKSVKQMFVYMSELEVALLEEKEVIWYEIDFYKSTERD